MSLQPNFNASRLNVTNYGGPLKHRRRREFRAECPEAPFAPPNPPINPSNHRTIYLKIHVPNGVAPPDATFYMRFYRTNPPALQTKKLSMLAHPPIAAARIPHPASEADR